MAKFDPTKPEQIVQDALESLQSIAISKTQHDFERRFDAVHDDEWLKLLGTLRRPFIDAAGAADLGKINAIAAFRKLWEAALRIRNVAGDLVTDFTVIGSRKIDAALGKVGDNLGGQWTVTAEDRWMHSHTMNRKLLESVQHQFFDAANTMSELSSLMRPKPSKNGIERGPGRPREGKRQAAIRFWIEHEKTYGNVSDDIRFRSVNESLKHNKFETYDDVETLKRYVRDWKRDNS